MSNQANVQFYIRFILEIARAFQIVLAISTMSQDYTSEMSMQSFAQGRADFAPCGVGSQPRNLIGHLATSEVFNQNQVVPQHRQGCDRRHYSLFYINVFKIDIICILLIF